MMVFGQYLFNMGGRYFEVAEQAGMTYGARHCALNKMRVGIRLSGLVPTPDVDWAWGLVCDEATKIDEYINCLYDEDWKVVATRLPHDTHMHEKGWDDPHRVKFLAQELRHSMAEVEKITGITVKPEHMNEAFNEFQQMLVKSSQLNGMTFAADPQPLCSSTLLVAGMVKAYPFNTGLQYIIDGLTTLIGEVEKDIKKGIGIYPKGAPKVGFYFIPWAIPWVDKMFRDNGVATSISTAFMPAK
jgi:benzoyl-CoA reductase/2-hydroxyglutaryl-CoA dehydratase subunit BcrC/BadD/HgdB